MIEGRDYAIAATIGARRRQEDCSGLDPEPPRSREGSPGLLAVVADGMGGAPAGDQASQLVVDAFISGYGVAEQASAAERLHFALEHANQTLGEKIRVNAAELTGEHGESAGCTLIASLFFADRYFWLSIGDSLILRYRNGRLERINPLHVYAIELDELVRRNRISAAEADAHPDRLALTSAVLGAAIEQFEQGEENLLANDILLLSTDGIDTLDEAELTGICLAHQQDANEIARAIIQRIDAAERAGQDNATVFVVRRGAYAGDEVTTEVVPAG